MAKVFISYSRKDIDFSRQLTERFENEGFDAWVDWQDIPPSVDWMNEIKQGIEEADVFLYLVSSASVTSQICKNELDHAVLNGKRIIPVIVQDIEPATVPAEISHLNWIFFSRPQDEFDAAFEKLNLAVKMDFDWVQVHKRLQIKALEWERNEQEASFLLRGRDLEDALAQLTVNADKQPLPTEIQKAYVEKSRQAEEALAEQQRAREQELEVEKTIGVRSRRLTYILLAVFTLAFAFLYLWLYKLVEDLSLVAIKNQMITMIETSTVVIDGDRFQSLTNDYLAEASEAYADPYFSLLEATLTNIKNANTNIDPNMSLYVLVMGSNENEILVVASADREYGFKDSFFFDSQRYAQSLGMETTSTDFEITNNEFGSRISACTPIRTRVSESVGALCTDFHIDIIQQTQANVAKTLGIAFLAIYPAMILMVIFSTRSVSKRFARYGKIKTP